MFGVDVIDIDFDYDFDDDWNRVYKVRSWTLTKNIIGKEQTFSQVEVNAFSPELVQKIEEKVAEHLVKYPKILAEKERQREEEQLAKNKQELEQFKQFMNETAPQEFWNLKPKFEELDKSFNFNATRITFKDHSGWDLVYVPERRDGRKWYVEFGYSDRRRYKKLESFIKRANEMIDAQKARKARVTEKEDAYKELEKQTGMTVTIERKWHRGHTPRTNYTTETRYLVPAEEANYSYPSFKIRVEYYSETMHFYETTIRKEYMTENFVTVQTTEIDTKFDNVEDFLTFVEKVV